MKKFTLLPNLIFAFFFASAQIIHVPDDYSTIQAGIDAANNGDTVLVADGLYYENINFLGKKPLMIASEFLLDGDTSHISNTIINGSQPENPDIGSVVTFESGEDTTSVLCGLTITGGTGTLESSVNMRMGGGLHIKYSGGKFLNNYIHDNTVSYSGGVYGGGMQLGGPISDIPWLVLRKNRIYNNKAISSNDISSGGGAVCFYNLIMKDNQISYNSADGYLGGDGGGLAIAAAFGHITIDVSENEMSYNEAVTDLGTPNYATLGGGMGIYFDVSGSISNNNISYNSLKAPNTYISWGSGAFVQDITSDNFTFENNILQGNIANTGKSWGGGLSLLRAGGVYQNNVLRNNTAYDGGGIKVTESNEVNATAILMNNTIADNVATIGGGIHIQSSKTVIINSIVWGNEATSYPSILVSGGSSLEVRYSDVESDELWPGEGNMNIDPGFQSDGYHLDYPSTLLNKGQATVLINGEYYDCPMYDIDGDERPFEWTNPEIGADEAPWLYVSVEESISSNINLYPNPANQLVTISNEIGSTINEVTIYNQTGQRVYRGVPENNTLDISKLQPGMYVVEVRTKEGNVRKKLIIQ